MKRLSSSGSDERRDRRYGRIIWLLALALLLSIAGFLGVVCFWPVRSPDPYYHQLLAIIKADSTPESEAVEQTAADDLHALSEALRKLGDQVETNYIAQHGSPPGHNAQRDKLLLGEYLWRRPEVNQARAPHDLLVMRVQQSAAAGYFDEAARIAAQPAIRAQQVKWDDLYDAVDSIYVPGDMRAVGNLLGDQLICAIQANDPTLAAKTLNTMMLLSRHSRDRSGFVGLLVCLSITDAACQAIDYALQQHYAATVEPTLTALFDILQQHKPDMSAYKSALTRVRVCDLHYEVQQSQKESPRQRLQLFSIGRPSLSRRLDAINRAFDQCDAIAESDDPRNPVWSDELADELAGSRTLTTLAKDICNRQQRIRRYVIAANTCLNAARIRVAIELYRARTGLLPLSLDNLVPSVLQALPDDPYAPDRKFRYRITGDELKPTYVLYSVGLDAVDNNGAVPPAPNDPTRPLSDEDVTGYDAVFNATRYQ